MAFYKLVSFMDRYVESLNCRTTWHSKSPCRISPKFMELFMGYMERSFCGLKQTMLYHDSVQLKIELPDNFWRKSNIHNICKTVYGTCGKLHLLVYVNLALLWISMAKNRNCLITFDGILPYRILRVSVERFMGFRFWVNCCQISPAQSFLVPGPMGPMTCFSVSQLLSLWVYGIRGKIYSQILS